ncbi:MAG: alpha/beta fold hydrolase [Planctomycetota bacterium]
MKDLGFTIEALYAVEEPDAPALAATFRVGKRVLARTAVGPRPVAGRLDLTGLAPGDHELVLEFRLGEDPEGAPLLRRLSRFSILADPAATLARLDAALAAEGVDAAPVRRESLREIRTTLTRIAEGERLETDLPAAALAARAESWAAMKTPRDEDLLPAAGGEFHLVLRAGETRVPVRVLVPARKDGKPAPLVVALHGMGGSENMFFEGYGAGMAPRLAAERGWIFVAPRLSAFGGFDLGAMIDDLARLAPIDPDRVYLVGHSMGAARALGAATQDPARWAAAAFLGGGLATRRAEALKGLPILVAAGERDFAKPGARALFASLEAVPGHAARYLETPDTEHMTVVRAALPDVFALFESAKRKPAPGQPEGKEG